MLRTTMAPDIAYDLPQSRERTTGAETIVRFFAEYPGDWRIRVTRVADGHTAASKIEFAGDNGLETGISFFELDDAGKITSIVDTWPEPFEPPFERSHLLERY